MKSIKYRLKSIQNLFKFTQNVLEDAHSCVFITSDTLDIYFFLFLVSYEIIIAIVVKMQQEIDTVENWKRLT